MSEQNTVVITDKMIKAALYDEEGNRHSDKELAEMLFQALYTTSAIAESAILLAQLVVGAEEEGAPLYPSQIGFAAFSSPESTEPDQAGTMLSLAKALEKYVTESGMAPNIADSKTVRKKELVNTSRIFH